jgi:hypothetical protein
MKFAANMFDTVQNVDGLDVMAGLPKEKSVAVHGSYTSAQCVACRAVVPIDKFVAELVGKQETPPLCPKPKCRAFLKPSIVMYGVAAAALVRLLRLSPFATGTESHCRRNFLRFRRKMWPRLIALSSWAHLWRSSRSVRA